MSSVESDVFDIIADKSAIERSKQAGLGRLLHALHGDHAAISLAPQKCGAGRERPRRWIELILVAWAVGVGVHYYRAMGFIDLIRDLLGGGG